MNNKNTHSFSMVQENIKALDPHKQTQRWMSTRPQMCWKCQQEKPVKGGSIKMFGSVRRFICVDCVISKQVAIAKANGSLL